LEGVFARGDRRLSRAVESAFRAGSRLDGWGDLFRFPPWEQAFAETGLDPAFYTSRRRDPGEILPWDHLDSRVSKRFLLQEREKARQGLPTADCRRSSCNGCGVCFGEEALANRTAPEEEFLPRPPEKNPDRSLPVRRFRLRFQKVDRARYLGHLELTRLLQRAMRRAKIPLVFSQGFHPLPRVSFGPPLPVGHESEAEFFDIQIRGRFFPGEALREINGSLPPGVQALEIHEISLKSPSIFDMIEKITYQIFVPDSAKVPPAAALSFRDAEKFPARWARKNRPLDLKSVVERFSRQEGNRIELTLRANPEGTPRPEEVLALIYGWTEAEKPFAAVRKIRVDFKQADLCPARS
jgi:radical SAM-linked protein